MKMIRKLLTTLLVLLSITVAFASIASDISVTSTNNNGAIAHGQTDSRTLTFTNSNLTDSFNVAATSPNSTIQIPSSNQILVSNLSSNTLSYNVSVPEHTSPGNYSYDIEPVPEMIKLRPFRSPEKLLSPARVIDLPC